MKIAILFLSWVLVLSACSTTKNIKETPAADNALTQNAVAVWEGNLPCADCETLDYQLTLKADKSFDEKSLYRGESLSEVHETGTWVMNNDSVIILKQGETVLKYFSFHGQHLEMMDLEGKPIESSLNYQLQKLTIQDMELLTEGRWRLMEMNGERILVADTAKIPTLAFDVSNKKIQGRGGCNNYSGSFTIKANMIEFGPIMSTKMACTDMMEIETAFFGMLSEKTLEHHVADGKLYLGEANTGLVFFRL